MAIDVLKFLNFLNEEKNIQFHALPNTNRVEVHREIKIPKRNPDKQRESAITADGRVNVPSGNPEQDEIRNTLSDSQKIQLETAAKLFSELHSKYNSGVDGEDSKTVKKELKNDLHDHFLTDTGSRTPTTYTLKDRDGNPVWHMHVRHPATTDRSLAMSGAIGHSHYGNLGNHAGDISFIDANNHNNRFGVEVKTLGGYFGGSQRYSGEEPSREDIPHDEETSKEIIGKHMADMKANGIGYVVLARRNAEDPEELDTKTFSTDESTEDNHSLIKIINPDVKMKQRLRGGKALKALPKSQDAIDALKAKTESEIKKLKELYDTEDADDAKKEQIKKHIESYEELMRHLSDPDQLNLARRMYAAQIANSNQGLQLWTQRIQDKFMSERAWLDKVFQHYASDGHSIDDMFKLMQQG